MSSCENLCNFYVDIIYFSIDLSSHLTRRSEHRVLWRRRVWWSWRTTPETIHNDSKKWYKFCNDNTVKFIKIWNKSRWLFLWWRCHIALSEYCNNDEFYTVSQKKLDLLAWDHLRRSNFFWDTMYIKITNFCFFIAETWGTLGGRRCWRDPPYPSPW